MGSAIATRMLDIGALGGYLRPMDAENVREDKPTGVIRSLEFQRAEGVEGVPSQASIPPPPSHDSAEAFALHFFRCFFCRVGDRLINDYFCETGRELIVAMLDDIAEREWART